MRKASNNYLAFNLLQLTFHSSSNLNDSNLSQKQTFKWDFEKNSTVILSKCETYRFPPQRINHFHFFLLVEFIIMQKEEIISVLLSHFQRSGELLLHIRGHIQSVTLGPIFSIQNCVSRNQIQNLPCMKCVYGSQCYIDCDVGVLFGNNPSLVPF